MRPIGVMQQNVKMIVISAFCVLKYLGKTVELPEAICKSKNLAVFVDVVFPWIHDARMLEAERLCPLDYIGTGM